MTSRMIAVMPISRPAWRCEICQQFKPCCLQTAIVGLAPTHKDPTTVATPLQLMIPAADVAPKAKRAIPADCSDSELLASMIRLLIGQDLQIGFSATVPTLESNYFSRKSRTICIGIGIVVEALALLGRYRTTGSGKPTAECGRRWHIEHSSTLKDARRTVTKRPI
jgi:hypothetical protein